jgi:thiamine-monophosphate kinase
MLINKIGEFGLIERFRKAIKTDASVIKASGDDCAVLKPVKDKYQLFTCDMIVEGVDFTSQDNPCLIGRKALAVSISDIAACGGIPTHAVVSLGIPKNTSVSYIDKVAKGLFSLAREFKVNVVGGDISAAPKMVIDTSLLGVVEKDRLVLRSGAKAGDIIFVTGQLGGSLAGKHLQFMPRIKEARYLVKHLKINAMIDISDGLLADLGHILEESRAGAVIYEAMLPLSRQAKGLNDALYSGEDFELLFTLPVMEAKKLLKKELLRFYKPIGKIVEKSSGLTLIAKNNRQRKVRPKGYRHF